jgi:hypothetical protein
MAVKAFPTTRSIMNLDGAPWVDTTEAFAARGGRGTQRKKFLTAPDGHRVGLANFDGVARPHVHTKASTLFILAGEIELRGRVAGPGCWVLEPYGAIHPQTRFTNVTYGLGMSDGDFGVGNVGLTSVDEIPDWIAKLGFKVDEFAHLVDSATLGWAPFGDGLSMKVLHVFDGRPAFAALIRAKAGASLPPRHYLGPADAYVLSGQIDFHDAHASAGDWVHQPAGARDERATFPVATEFLANTYGTILEFDARGSFARAIDGYALKGGPQR